MGMCIPTVFAQSTQSSYQLLTPLPGANNTSISSVNTSDPLPYIIQMAEVLVSLGVVVAVFFIVYGGIIQMSTDNIEDHREGQAIIKRTLIGLALLAFSYILINTINPSLFIDVFKQISGQTQVSSTNTSSNTTNSTNSTSNNQITCPQGTSEAQPTQDGYYVKSVIPIPTTCNNGAGGNIINYTYYGGAGFEADCESEAGSYPTDNDQANTCVTIGDPENTGVFYCLKYTDGVGTVHTTAFTSIVTCTNQKQTASQVTKNTNSSNKITVTKDCTQVQSQQDCT